MTTLTNVVASRISPANIIVPSVPPFPPTAPVEPYVSPAERWSDQQKDIFLNDLAHVLNGLPDGLNKNDRANVAINVCIDAGIDTEKLIIRVLAKSGFKGGHIANRLKHDTGNDPSGNHWARDTAGRFYRHPSAAAKIAI